MLVLLRLHSGTAVKLGSTGCGEQCVGGGVNLKAQMQAIAADHAAGGVQDVGMANVTFGIERALHRQRAALRAAGKHGFGATLCETELQFGLPGGSCCGHTVKYR
jgi:hypothetical protein